MIYNMTFPVSGDFYMDEPQAKLDEEFMGLALEQYFPGPVSLSGAELAEYEREIQFAFHDIKNTEEMEDNMGLFQKFQVDYLKSRIHYVDVSVRTVECCLQGEISISVKGKLSEDEKDILNNYIWKEFCDGFGSRCTKKDIVVSGGRLRICFENPETCMLIGEKKYKVTNHSHPKYPWLHRIQARILVNESVPAGTLGGYVEGEGNLSQEGSCWIHDNAICCEHAEVEKDAQLFDGTCAKGAALVTGDAVMFDSATADGNCCVRSGEVKDYARIAGNAVIGESMIDGLSPLIQGNSKIYGTVRGGVIVKDVVLPGEEIVNPTEDMFILENGKRDVLVKQRELTPPEGYQNHRTNRKPEPER